MKSKVFQWFFRDRRRLAHFPIHRVEPKYEAGRQKAARVATVLHEGEDLYFDCQRLALEGLLRAGLPDL